MKAIIDGKRYDTSTAKHIGSASSDYGLSDLRHWTEDLYRTEKGQHFLAGEGGPKTRWAQPIDSGMASGSGIRLLSADEARAWAERYLKTDQVEAAFEIEDG
jgi:hypothetical protein